MNTNERLVGTKKKIQVKQKGFWKEVKIYKTTWRKEETTKAKKISIVIEMLKEMACMTDTHVDRTSHVTSLFNVSTEHFGSYETWKGMAVWMIGQAETHPVCVCST